MFRVVVISRVVGAKMSALIVSLVYAYRRRKRGMFCVVDNRSSQRGGRKILILLSGQSPQKQIRFTGTEIPPMQRKWLSMTKYNVRMPQSKN